MMSMLPVTICFTYFRSLGLANLQAALYSISKQDLSRVESIVVVDNNTDDPLEEIIAVIDGMSFAAPVNVHSFKHGDATKTHSWSTNYAVSRAFTPWILVTRADYLLDFDIVARFMGVVDAMPSDWIGFVTGNVYHLNVDVGVCEQSVWRSIGPRALRVFPGAEESYTCIDAGVWMLRRRAFNQVCGLDESLNAWGHAQTHFQYRLHQNGVAFVRIPESLFYHPLHSAPRDIELAHRQLQERGIDIHELWARYEGAQPYERAV